MHMSLLDAPAPRCTPPLGLIAVVRERIRNLHYSLRTEEACVHWVRAFRRFHDCGTGG